MELKHMRIVLDKIPALVCFADTAVQAGERGTVLLYHGLGAHKESQTKELATLAEQGFLAICVDAVGHGERKLADFDIQFARDNRDSEQNFVALLLDNVREIPCLIDMLVALGWTKPGKIGITGISMGGYISYASPLVDRRINVAAPILGSPQWKIFHAESPHLFPERFFPTALLAQNAGADQFVPCHFARDFHRKLKPYYLSAPERIHYIEFPEAGHFMVEAEWNALWHNVIAWFNKFLKG